MKQDFSYYKGKRILVTGHTGFKGSWICRLLLELGAEVTGYALEPPTKPAMFTLCGLKQHMRSETGDIRDLEHLQKVFCETQPEGVIHMAAQPIVREGYRMPVETYEINVMGTVNVLESIRQTDSVSTVINVTTDKVYANKERREGYREEEELNGFDPYSNSKSCSELVTSSYRKSFFQGERKVAVSTMRAGNVIGGGDFARDRILPDCIRAIEKGEKIGVRNPDSIRPYQHVLEPITAYLMVLMEQDRNHKLSGSYNIGPEEEDSLTTGEMVTRFCRIWQATTDRWEAGWQCIGQNGPHEASLLRLNCEKLKETFGWQPSWRVDTALQKTAEWYNAYLSKEDLSAWTGKQIKEYFTER